MPLEQLLVIKVVAAATVFVALFSAERVFRAARPPASRARLVRNVALWGIVLLASPLIVAPLTAWGANQVLWTRPEWMTAGMAGVGFLILDLIVLDFWTYWLHRAYHQVPPMWRLHEVHHRDEFLDTTSAVRFHLGEVILSAVLRFIPIMVLAPPLASVIVFEMLVLCAAFFHHSNVRLPTNVERALSRLIVTPSIHWVHHHAVVADTNSNYATVFSLWDPLFGTRSATKRQHDMKIGVEGVEDQSLLRLILMPLWRNG